MSRKEEVFLIEDEIISIEEIGDGDTIDISVDDTRMFFANGIYTHNSGFNAEWIDATQMGGSIKRAQKSHFLMSIAKTPEQQREGRANIQILKSRFAASGQIFENAIFDNNTMQIEIYNTGENKKPMKINKPSIEHNSMIEEEIESPKMFNMSLLNQSRDDIEEESFSDDYDIILDNKSKEQEKIEKSNI